MKTIGVLGGGQLGRMLALAGYRLGLNFEFFDSVADACAAQVGPLFKGDFADESSLTEFATTIDVMTLEWENVPLAAAQFLAGRMPFQPPPRALEVAQDRLLEKNCLRDLDIATAPFAAVDSPADLDAAIADIGLHAVLKTRRGGYDGHGQGVVKTADEAHAFLAAWPQPLIYEGFVDFQRELSIIAVRSTSGEVGFYPLVENHHREGILRLTLAPAPDLTPELQARAEEIARRLLDHFDYAGVLAIELFQAGDELMANEIAPRVHNSGHWSIDGAVTSQFENHVRAICGLPLGDCAASGESAMVNLIGNHPPIEQLLAVPGARVHLYGKSARPGRKLGHVNLCATGVHALIAPLTQLLDLVKAYEA